MESALIPILLFAGCAAAIAFGMIGVGRLFGPRRNSAIKQMPYESGMDPIHDARRRFDVRFHLVAIAFLVFDVELLFLYPWAVASRDYEHGLDQVAKNAGVEVAGFRMLVFGEVMVFIALLALGLFYAWRKGVLRWR
jgi:NADH-quinone oxidoreductase subunit A